MAQNYGNSKNRAIQWNCTNCIAAHWRDWFWYDRHINNFQVEGSAAHTMLLCIIFSNLNLRRANFLVVTYFLSFAQCTSKPVCVAAGVKRVDYWLLVDLVVWGLVVRKCFDLWLGAQVVIRGVSWLVVCCLLDMISYDIWHLSSDDIKIKVQ